MVKYLKNKEGMALPMVLIIMLILTGLAAAFGTYASQSLRSVKYMNAQKQAYYLARVGVEAGAYAYQNATLSTSSTYEKIDNAGSFKGIDAVVSVLQDVTDVNGQVIDNPGKIVSNTVYLIYNENETTEGSIWDGLEFVTAADKNAPNVIGYFTVEASAATNKVLQETETGDLDANGDPVTEMVPTDLPVVEFRSTAVCFDANNGEIKNVVTGFVYPPDKVSSKQIADVNGVLSTDPGDFTEHVTETISVDSGGTVQGGNYRPGIAGILDRIVVFAKQLWNGLVKGIYEMFFGSSYSTKVEIFEYISGGDLIFSPPEKSDSYRLPQFKSGQSAYAYAFASSETLFMNAGLDATTGKGEFATIGLFGKDIVVDGDIKMSAYVNNPDYAVGGMISQIISTFGNRYRLGTVVIGSGSKSGGDFGEYLTHAQGGITDETGATINNANRIFFKGNVTVTVYMQGSAAETYRIFSAGDVCLFDGWYETKSSNGDTTYGVDLFKFFVDSVVDGDPLYAYYGESVRENLEAVREFYYGDQESYIRDAEKGKTRPMRVLEVNRFASTGTGMTIDGKDITTEVNGKKLLRYIQQPVASASSNIHWGQPSGSAWKE